MYHGYSEAIRILMRESGSLDADNRVAVGQYLSAVIPFVEQYEKKQFRIGRATPEKVLGFLMEEHDLSQYDLAKELGGEPGVSQILSGRLTREHIERLSRRSGVTPATFYPGGTSAWSYSAASADRMHRPPEEHVGLRHVMGQWQ